MRYQTLSLPCLAAALKITCYSHDREAKRLVHSSPSSELASCDAAAWQGLMLDTGANCNAFGKASERPLSRRQGLLCR